MTASDPLIICTAWNAAYAKIGEFCSEGILQHIRRVEANGGGGITFQSRIIPDDYPRPASWFKLDLLKELLATNPHVLWIDCDALFVDQGDVREAIPDAPLCICEDVNGVNGGVMAWHDEGGRSGNCLENIASRYEEFKYHPWWEQPSIAKQMSFTKESGDIPWWNIMPKDVMNAYTNEICPATRIVHFAGFSPDEKLKLMEAQILASRRNGHGPRRA